VSLRTSWDVVKNEDTFLRKKYLLGRGNCLILSFRPQFRPAQIEINLGKFVIQYVCQIVPIFDESIVVSKMLKLEHFVILTIGNPTFLGQKHFSKYWMFLVPESHVMIFCNHIIRYLYS
jgi:hypothetical protein